MLSGTTNLLKKVYKNIKTMQSIRVNNQFLWSQCENIDPAEILKVQELFQKNMPAHTSFFQPLKIGLDKFAGLEVSSSVLIYARPFSNSTIHTDYRADNLELALNLPLQNCDNSCTKLWMNVNSPIHVRYTELGIPYNFLEKDKCKVISEFKLIEPIIFNTKVPHSVHNFSDQPRLSISLRFKEDPWHLVGR